MQGVKRLTAGAAVIAATVASAAALADSGNGTDRGARHDGVPTYGLGRSYTVALWGDQPYGAAGKAEYPRLLADLNDARPAFGIYDGDLKAGGDGVCTDDLCSRRPDASRRRRRRSVRTSSAMVSPSPAGCGRSAVPGRARRRAGAWS